MTLPDLSLARNPRPRRAGREAAHRARHLSADAQRARRRLQPEDEPRSDPERRDADVQATLDRLKRARWSSRSSGGRVMRYAHNVERVLGCRRSRWRSLAVLMLRGPQTAGELRINSDRLHRFADISTVEGVPARARRARGGALVVELPRAPGTRETRWMHLLSGPAPTDAAAASTGRSPTRARSSRRTPRRSRRSSRRCGRKWRRCARTSRRCPLTPRANAEQPVRRHGDVDQLRPRQVQVAHQRDERRAVATGEPRVVPLLVADRRHGVAVVIVRGPHARVVGQREEPLVHAVVERAASPLWKSVRPQPSISSVSPVSTLPCHR